VHILVGTLIFVALVVPAVGLSFLAKSELIAASSVYLTTMIQWMSYSLLLADILLYLIFVIRATIRAFREISYMDKEG
ncbi:MAG: hypothetical protein ACPGO7_04035, partial [Alphaproteobacteria bacterium]